MPPRKPGTLLPLEAEILTVALSLHRAGQPVFHGFGLAQAMRQRRESRSLTAHGTLYKALGRLEDLGLLSSRWEDAVAAEQQLPSDDEPATDAGAEGHEHDVRGAPARGSPG